MTSYRAGERAQVLALAAALGRPFEIKELALRGSAALVSLVQASNLRGIRLEQSDRLVPPWPDVVISAGMRNEPVVRWIREQSGGRTRLVHIGRPWAPLSRFDLVITTPQYRLPRRPNVLHNPLTLHSMTREGLQAAAVTWQSRLADLPRPWIAVIVGGNSGPYTFGARAARRLARQASEMARGQGGSLLVTTSARTTSQAGQVLAEHITVPRHFYPWRADDENNPYFGYLALADAIIVTADSISMLTEACATGKPVYMFDTGSGRQAMRPSAGSGDDDNDFRLSGDLYRGVMRWAPKRLSRDITLVHRSLCEAGNAVWLGEPFPDQTPPPLRDMEHAVARVRALFSADEQTGTV